MRISQPRKLYVPALVIVAVVLSLLVFIGFSTYWNLHHARQNALKFVHQRGVATIQLIETSIRSMQGSDISMEKSINRLIKEVGENDYVAYVYMVSKNYGVFYHSAHLPPGTSGAWLKKMSDMKDIISRIRPLADGSNVYELAEAVGPDVRGTDPSFDNGKEQNGRFIVVGLDMATYETARQQDFHHAIVMLSILAILGGGAVFFIFVIHLYHRMNQRLRENQEYTRQVVDSMANGLLSIDKNGQILSYNRLAMELLGIDVVDAAEINLEQVIDFDLSGIGETLDECVSVMDREITAYHHYCGTIPLAISVTPITVADGDCRGAVIILRDLREIKQLEEKIRRTEKLAALGKLSAAVAHEIRNPLSSIRGFAKFLSHALKDRPKDRDYADIMVKEVDRINRVVTDLLNFTRPLELDLQKVNPAELMAHSIRLVEGDAQSRNIAIYVDTAQSPASVRLDPYQITQLLLNLMLNALQAVSDGQSLSVGVSQNADASRVLFWVEDDGVGIDKADIDRIFDPFFTQREKGTGLGLAIVQKIVENHHGTVRVASPVGGKIDGCRFTVTLPMNLEPKG